MQNLHLTMLTFATIKNSPIVAVIVADKTQQVVNAFLYSQVQQRLRKFVHIYNLTIVKHFSVKSR
jgi:hypothetical protein